MRESNPFDRERHFADLTFRFATPQEVWTLDRAGLANSLLKCWIGWTVLSGLNTAAYVANRLWEKKLAIYQFEGQPIPRWPTGADWQYIMPGIVLILISAGILISLGFGLRRLCRGIYCQLYELGIRQTWLALDRDRTIARVDIERYATEERRIITHVWVDPDAWWQGLGTETLRTYVREMSADALPLFVICSSQFVAFFKRLGFISVKPGQLSRKLQHRPGQWMELREPLATFNSPATEAVRLPTGLTMQKVRGYGQRWNVYQTFWRYRTFRQSRYAAAALVACLALPSVIAGHLITWIVQDGLRWQWLREFTIYLWQLPISLAAFGIAALILWRVWVVLVGSWQEWVVLEGDRPVAYSHLSVRQASSVCHGMSFKPNAAGFDVARRALLRLSSRLPMPVFVSSSRDATQPYAALGFERAVQSELPRELKLLPRNRSVFLKLTRPRARSRIAKLPIANSPAPAIAPPFWWRRPPETRTNRRKYWLAAGLLLAGLWVLSPLSKTSQVRQRATQQQAIASDPVARSSIAAPSHRGYATAIAFSADGSTALVGNRDNGTIEVWNWPTQTLVKQIETGTDGVSAVAFGVDDNIAIAACQDGSIQFRTLKNGKLRASRTTHAPGHIAMAVSADRSVAVTGGKEGGLVFWNTRNGRIRKTAIAHQQAISDLALSPDGRWLASASNDRTATVWDVAQQKLMHTFADHNQAVTAVAFSPDNQLVISSGRDGVIRLRSPISGHTLKTLTHQASAIGSLLLSADGHTLYGHTRGGRLQT